MLINVYDRCVQKEQVVDWLVPSIIKLSQTEDFRKHDDVREFLLRLECSSNIRTHNIA
jgi:hypothetical protein